MNKQRELEQLIRQHPDWGYARLNRGLKESTGQGIRKQVLLDVKRKVLHRAAPTPRAEARTKLIQLFVTPLPNQVVRQLRADGFKDFEIAELLAKKRKLKDGTFIDTTPPADGDTLDSMIKARKKLLSEVDPKDFDNVIVGAYQDNSWTKEDSTLDFWQMFRQFFRNSDSPVISKGKQTTLHFGKGNVVEQKRRARERKKGMQDRQVPVSERGTPVYTTDGRIAYYRPADAKWDGKKWSRN